MDRNQAKELLPIIQAFSEGKTLQIRQNGSEWMDIETASFTGFPSEYRIKPETTYRPFANAEECWQEMLKHKPFGWVKWGNVLRNVHSVSPSSVWMIDRSYNYTDLEYAYKELTFADGAPFGVKVEK